MGQVIRKLTTLDAAFLYLETPEMPMHVGSMSVFRLPEGYSRDFYEDFKAMIGRRLHLAPILRWCLDKAPLDLDHPSWIEDDQFDLDRHIFRGALPEPQNVGTLQRIVGWMHAKLLNRARPLWEIYVFEHLENNEVAIYTKIHHACVDGGAAAAMFEMIHDATPVPREVPPADPAALDALIQRRGPARTMLSSFLRPAVERLLSAAGNRVPESIRAEGPSSVVSIVDICLDQLQQPINLLRELPTILPEVGKAVGSVANPKALQEFGNIMAPSTSINAPVSSERAFAGVSLPLSRVKAVAAKAGGKLNDGVMAVCAGALASWMTKNGTLPEKPMTAFVPISVRESGNTAASNQVAGMVCSLATDIADPKARLEKIIVESGRAKELSNPLRTLFPHLTNLSLLWGPMASQLAVLFINRSGVMNFVPPVVNVIISNVPGPRIAMYAAGAELKNSFPVSIVTHGIGLNITVQSYRDSMDFGLIAAANLLPHVQELADSFTAELEKLEKAFGIEPKPVRVALPKPAAAIAAPEPVAEIAVPVQTAPVEAETVAAAAATTEVAADGEKPATKRRGRAKTGESAGEGTA